VTYVGAVAQSPRGWQELCLAHLLQRQAEQDPGAPALLAPDRTSLPYRRLYRQVGAGVQSLNERGIGRGDRVALVLPDGAEAVTMSMAAAAEPEELARLLAELAGLAESEAEARCVSCRIR
jgi:acyl-CoA synthetase (AMP-forming)/AMP-acid ligase II